MTVRARHLKCGTEMNEEIDYIYSATAGDERKFTVGWTCPKCGVTIDTWGFNAFEASKKEIRRWDDDIEDEFGNDRTDEEADHQ